jgi:hypothetical protein
MKTTDSLNPHLQLFIKTKGNETKKACFYTGLEYTLYVLDSIGVWLQALFRTSQ